MMSTATQKSRMFWRCRRGMLELDVLLQGFLAHGYDDLPERERAALGVLLDYPDAVLYDLLMGSSVTSDRELVRVIEKIRTAPPA